MRKLAILAISALASLAIGQIMVGSAGAATLTVAPNTPAVGNSFFFGIGSGGLSWNPFGGFVYKNIAAFQLKAGDTIAFDTAGVQNDFDIQMDIDLARTTANGGDVAAQPFTRVVLNNQIPSSPRGDTTVGNFELQFKATAPFNFPGGGLIIRFSNPSPGYAADTTSTQNLVYANATDTSGFFVKRVYQDADGVAPWTGQTPTVIGGFRLTLENPPVQDPPKCQGKTATIVGSNGPDQLRGTQQADVFVALGGSDTVVGRRGNDIVCAGGGKDTVGGGAGRDAINGENGADLLRGGKGADTIRGGKGKDTMSGGPKDDLCIGGAGKDVSRNC